MKAKTLQQIGRDIVTLAKALFKKNVNDAVNDGRAFLEATKQQAAIWLNQLAAGEITRKNFESLMRGERELAEMQTLKHAGLALVTIDTFTKGIVEIIINAALASIVVI